MLTKFFNRLRPADIIGLITIICGFYLLLHGIDKAVSGIIIMVVTYYFVRSAHHDNTKTDSTGSGNGGV